MPIFMYAQETLMRMELKSCCLDKLKKKELFKLNDSMEFYKSKEEEILAPYSPPTISEPLIIIGNDEEDECEEMPILKRFLINEDDNSETKEDPIDLEDFDDGNDVADLDLQLNVDYSDSDEIVFDSDAEEEETKIPTVIETPFWFGNEDNEQMRYIAAKYGSFLKLPEEKKRLIRQPEPFVGKIKRNKVDNGDIFTTFDEVEIYRRSLLPLGSVMPIIRTVYVLTSWSFEDGLPIQFASLPTERSRKMWRDRIIPTTGISILLCLPVYDSVTEYHFFVGRNSLEVTHSPYLLRTIQQWWSYEKYIPRQPQNFSEEQDCKGA